MASVQATSPPLAQQHAHEYNCWKNMRARCLNPRSASFAHYRERGIQVCVRWADSFADFLNDMGPAPSPEHQVDRVNNDHDYEPGNCAWATPAEQQGNTSKVVYLTFRGVTLSRSQWARIFDVPETTLRMRLTDLGWDVERALLELRQQQQRRPTRKPVPENQLARDGHGRYSSNEPTVDSRTA